MFTVSDSTLDLIGRDIADFIREADLPQPCLDYLRNEYRPVSDSGVDVYDDLTVKVYFLDDRIESLDLDLWYMSVTRNPPTID